MAIDPVYRKFSKSQLETFINIREDASPQQPFSSNTDFFVGKSQSITWTLPPGAEVRVRDICVLGELIIRSSGGPDSARPIIRARDIVNAGNLEIKQIEINGNTVFLARNRDSFLQGARARLQELDMEAVD